VIGHEVRLSETNRGGFVPICECGWIGAVPPMQYKIDPTTARKRKLRDLSRSLANDAHALHLHDVRADIARDSDRELARIGKLIPLANATLQRRGRWGRG
jgi:hypothetical protein